MIELRLPIPPSANNLFINRKGGKGYGRIKSKQYRNWLAEADSWFFAQYRRLPVREIRGACTLRIRIPKVRGDISNRIKAAEDYLVTRLVTSDDKNNRRVSIEVDPGLTGEFCVIELKPADGYNAVDDFGRSIDACYEAVRERVKAGGPTWEG